MKHAVRLMVAALVMACCIPSHAQEDVIRQWDFEEDLGGWATLDDQATLERSNAEDARFRGEWSLEFTFPQRVPDPANPDVIPGAIFAMVDGDTADLKSVRFAAAGAYSTPLMVILNEDGGASFMSVAWIEAGHWNECELDLSHFVPTDETPDDRQQLDPARIESIAFADGSVIARGIAAEGLPVYVPPAAEMTLWLDEVVLSSSPAPGARVQEEDGTMVIDRFDNPTIKWLALGGEDVHLVLQEGDEPDAAGHLEVQFITPAGTAFALATGLRRGDLEGKSGLSLEMKMQIGNEVGFVVEEHGGARYVTMQAVRGSGRWQDVYLPFSTFFLAPDSTDPNSRLDPEEINRIIIVDIIGAITGAMSANTWGLRDLVATP